MGSSADRRKESKLAARVAARLGSMQSKKPIDSWLQLLGMAMGLGFWLWPNKTPMGVVIALFLMFLCFVHPLWNFWWIEDGLMKRGGALVILCATLVWFGFAAWPTAPPKSHPADNRNPNKPFDLATVTLQDLFFRDLSSPEMGIFGSQTMRSQTFGNIKVITCASLDFARSSVVVGFYVPFWNDTFSVAHDIAVSDLTARVLTSFDNIQAETKYAGDTTTRTSTNAVFSGVVYVYHEKEMSAEEIGELTKLYSSKNLRVQFRSQSYLEIAKLKSQRGRDR